MTRRLTALLGVAALAVAACGGSDGGETTGTGSDGETRTVSVGMLPILPTAALHAGIAEGFFEEEGLEVEIETGQGGAALLPAVASGQMEFATGNPVSLLQAREEGLDVRMTAHWTSGLTEGEGDINGVIALDGSGLESAADLAVHTVAVNTLEGMGGLTVREAVRQDGGDPDAVEFTELGFPDMPAALNDGNVDAVWIPEPFMTSLVDGDAHVVTHQGRESVPGHPTQVFFTSGDLVESDPELVESMTRAMNKTLEFADENPDAVREHVNDFLDVEPDLLERVKLEEFGTDLREQEITQLGELMTQDGLLDGPADVDGLLQSAPDRG